jgi:hypothetical protein
MAVSEAKLEANRRNAKKSTGPRTQNGKDNSKFNALNHGCRAKTVLLPGEDAQALEARQAAWSACIPPADDLQAAYLHDAVVNSWQLDRARRTQATRLTANILDYGIERDQVIMEDVSELGRQLFMDRLGPLTFYPSPPFTPRQANDRKPTTSFAGPNVPDPGRPAALILRLQSTLLGCEWMLGEWARLKAILERGQAWLSSDKLKAVRLLGNQPWDAIDEEEVALVFLASFALKPDNSSWYWEISMELANSDIKRFEKYAATRELDSLMPENPAKAREALMGIIKRAIERLTLKAEVHRERARVEAAMVPDLLAFDDSAEGERLRRYELACGRAMSRSLDKMLRLVDRPLPIDVGPLSVDIGPSSVVSGPLSDLGGDDEPTEEPNATNEPTVACENVTNEPTDACENATNEPTVACENATNEPTVACENATNEPNLEDSAEVMRTDRGCRRALRAEETRRLNEQNRNAAEFAMAARRDRLRRRRKKNGKPGPLSAVSWISGATAEPSGPDDPADARVNVTNEPKLTADGGGGGSVELAAVTDDMDDGTFYANLDRASQAKFIRDKLANVAVESAKWLRQFDKENPGMLEKALAGRRTNNRQLI